MQIDQEQFIGALDTMVTVYGLSHNLTAWTWPDYLKQEDDVYYPRDHMLDGNPMLEAIWVICVCLFGDWTTSPSEGYIEDYDEFCEFINEITETAKQGLDF